MTITKEVEYLLLMTQLKIKYTFAFILLFKSIYGQELVFITDTIVYDNYICINQTFNNNKVEGFLIDYVKLSKCHYPNGMLKEVSNENKYGLNGSYIKFYQNGQIEVLASYLNGRLINTYIEWYSNGKIKVKGFYLDIKCLDEIKYECDTIINSNDIFEYELLISCKTQSIKTGKWQYFNEFGILVKEENY